MWRSTDVVAGHVAQELPVLVDTPEDYKVCAEDEARVPSSRCYESLRLRQAPFIGL